MKLAATIRVVVPIAMAVVASATLILSSSLAGPNEATAGSGIYGAAYEGGGDVITAADSSGDPRDDSQASPPTFPSGQNPIHIAQSPSLPARHPATWPRAVDADRAENEFATLTPTEEENQLELDYLEAKLAALKLYAEAKTLEADGSLSAAKAARSASRRSPGSVAERELRSLDTQAALARAEAADMQAEIIRLRRELLIAKRRIGEQDSVKHDTPQLHPDRSSELSVGEELILEINFSIDERGTPRQVRIEPEGTIPLGARFGRVKVEGLTIADAEAKAKSALSRFTAGTISVQISRP